MQTIHAAQGAKTDRVLTHLESFRANIVDACAAYVAVSRVRKRATIFTDSRSKLAEVLGFRRGSQVAALDQDMEWHIRIV